MLDCLLNEQHIHFNTEARMKKNVVLEDGELCIRAVLIYDDCYFIRFSTNFQILAILRYIATHELHLANTERIIFNSVKNRKYAPNQNQCAGISRVRFLRWFTAAKNVAYLYSITR